jgi:hypothetical protein
MKSSIRITNNGNTIRATGNAAGELLNALTKSEAAPAQAGGMTKQVEELCAANAFSAVGDTARKQGYSDEAGRAWLAEVFRRKETNPALLAERDRLRGSLERIAFGSPYTANDLRDIARAALAPVEGGK